MAQTQERKVKSGGSGDPDAARRAAPPPADGTSGRKPHPKKKKGRGILILVLIVLIVVLIASAIVTVKFNIAGVRDRLIESVNSLDPRYTSLQDALDEKTQALEARKLELDAREDNLLPEEERLRQREELLNTREANVTQREANSIPIYREPLNEQDLADMTSLSKIYSSMDPVIAAEILVELYTTEDMAAILYYMAEKSAAPILAAMDVKLAAEITQLLLRD